MFYCYFLRGRERYGEVKKQLSRMLKIMPDNQEIIEELESIDTIQRSINTIQRLEKEKKEKIRELLNIRKN